MSDIGHYSSDNNLFAKYNFISLIFSSKKIPEGTFAESSERFHHQREMQSIKRAVNKFDDVLCYAT